MLFCLGIICRYYLFHLYPLSFIRFLQPAHLSQSIFYINLTSATSFSGGRMALCGKQACFPPNECLDVGDGVSVCVRTDGPQCAGVQCATGYQCALLQDVCVSLPCHPKAYCVRSSEYRRGDTVGCHIGLGDQLPPLVVKF